MPSQTVNDQIGNSRGVRMMWSNHIMKFNPAAPSSDPVANNGYGYPLLDVIGNSIAFNNFMAGVNVNGRRAGLSDLDDNGNQPLLHYVPKAWRIIIEPSHLYNNDPYIERLFCGEHILSRTNLFEYSVLGTNGNAQDPRGNIIWSSRLARPMFMPQLPGYNGPNVPNNSGEIYVLNNNVYVPDETVDIMPLYIGCHHGHPSHDGNTTDDTVGAREWTLWCAQNPLHIYEGDPDYFWWHVGSYPDTPYGTPFRPYIQGRLSENRQITFCHPESTYIPFESDCLFLPATITAIPYNG